ncbi:hypothetical protein T552_03396 [Pneumocystis carinii B80]|uniref:Uncharacterized protein n=1 Tax=Pneumocystis carinii (strain B80) TaxID=1408658 RepID=A0A0W4ZBP8_PNEC8|nr:hypothetical protein T552_03396 [Pneumocystis carinii B80]KTW25783.1 hypothetical protein T552_03396 [Pneumocystis carinii B80]
MGSFMKEMKKKKKCFVKFGCPEMTLIRRHPFNFSVELCLRKDDLSKVEYLLEKSNHPRFINVDVPLEWFLREDVLDRLIRTEVLCALSMNHIDVDDVVCVSKGEIILSLTKDTYEKAGLEGKPSAFSRKCLKWNVLLNMRETSMKKGKKGFNRVLWSFKNVFQRKFSFRMCVLDEDNIGILEEILGLSCCFVNFERNESGKILCPSFSYPKHVDYPGIDRIIQEEWATEIYEWLGLVSLGSERLRIDLNNDPYSLPYHLSDASQDEVVRLLWSGMICCTWIYNLWLFLRNLNDINWISLTVNGFEDSPISWENYEHGYFFGGENTYTILKLNSNTMDNNDPPFLVYEYINNFDQYS